MVERYFKTDNYSQVAREYGTTRKTVTRWLKRYEKEGEKGLKDKSRAPNSIPHKTPKEVEDKIEEIAKDKKLSIGQDRVKIVLETKEGIHLSTLTINRIMDERDLIREKKRKWKKKKQISKWRKKLNALSYFEVDVKDLSDIPNIFALVHEGIIPRYKVYGQGRGNRSYLRLSCSGVLSCKLSKVHARAVRAS